jgi:MYXO-CTERM domain-containing protein
MNRVFVVLLVGSVLAVAAIWGGAEASAPAAVEFMYIGFLALFGAALAAGVRKERHRRQVVDRRKGDSR